MQHNHVAAFGKALQIHIDAELLSLARARARAFHTHTASPMGASHKIHFIERHLSTWLRPRQARGIGYSGHGKEMWLCGIFWKVFLYQFVK